MMTTHTTPSRSRPRWRTGLLAVAAALAVGACSADGEDAAPVDDAPAGEDVAETDTDLGEAVDDAEEQLDEAGAVAEDGRTAEVDFQGAEYVFVSDEPFGCFITEDGGSMGAVDFEGVAEDGSEFTFGWAGDSTEFATGSLTLADGTEYQGPFTDPGYEVTITGSSAVVSGEFVLLEDGSPAEFQARVTCS